MIFLTNSVLPTVRTKQDTLKAYTGLPAFKYNFN